MAIPSFYLVLTQNAIFVLREITPMDQLIHVCSGNSIANYTTISFSFPALFNNIPFSSFPNFVPISAIPYSLHLVTPHRKLQPKPSPIRELLRYYRCSRHANRRPGRYHLFCSTVPHSYGVVEGGFVKDLSVDKRNVGRVDDDDEWSKWVFELAGG